MPSDSPSPDYGRLIRLAAALCLAAVTALAFVTPSHSLRVTLVTVLVVVVLAYAGWRLSSGDDERAERLPADD